MPPPPAVLVDISNIQRKGERHALLSDPRTLVLVSTHKTFNFFSAQGMIPPMPEGTLWIVLSSPFTDTAKGATKLGLYDASARTFSAVPFAVSPVRLRHHKKNADGERECSIEASDAKARMHHPVRSHSQCEIDDALIAHLCMRHGYAVRTNDAALRRLVRSHRAPPITPEMRALMDFSYMTPLVYRHGKWDV